MRIPCSNLMRSLKCLMQIIKNIASLWFYDLEDEIKVTKINASFSEKQNIL